jgi:predicted solute-binding protein
MLPYVVLTYSYRNKRHMYDIGAKFLAISSSSLVYSAIVSRCLLPERRTEENYGGKREYRRTTIIHYCVSWHVWQMSNTRHELWKSSSFAGPDQDQTLDEATVLTLRLQCCAMI